MKPILFAVLAGLCWGIGEVFTKSVLHTHKVGPVTAITVRSVVALPLLLALYFFWVHVQKNEPQHWLTDAGGITLAKLVLGSGLIAGAGGMVFFYLAISLGDISKVKPIAFTIAPAVGVILAWLTLGEPMSLRKVVALLLVLGGVVMLSAK